MNQAKSTSRVERRDAAENRQRILNAALRLFEQHGVEPVSMNQIAAEAQIGAGTLYRRYRNKSELCMDLIRDTVEMLFKDINNYLEENALRSPAERLRGLLVRFLGFKEKNAQLIAGIEHFATPQGSQSNSLYTDFHELLVKLFEEMPATPGQTKPDSVFRTDMLMTALSSDSYLFQKNVRGNSQEQILEQLYQTFI